ncbi:5-formyltetrahydrofolate cyclo-ligase [Spirosoma arcticum]
MTKSALRQAFLAQRRALSAEDVMHRSRAITNLLFDEFFDEFAENKRVILHTFLPIARQNEVDTWAIIHRVWQEFPGIKVAVPVAATLTNQLTHHLITPETPLTENRWGIPEPQPDTCVAINSEQIDLVLVPLLALDKRGHRVGYGMGYYDQFLAECRPDCLKIGVSHFEPVEYIADVIPTDVPLNACVTPKQVWRFDALFRHKNTT